MTIVKLSLLRGSHQKSLPMLRIKMISAFAGSIRNYYISLSNLWHGLHGDSSESCRILCRARITRHKLPEDTCLYQPLTGKRSLARGVHIVKTVNRRTRQQTSPPATNRRKSQEKEEEPMLVLSRKRDEMITIGSDIVIRVIKTGKSTVTFGIEAPISVRILRSELATNEMPESSHDAETKHEDHFETCTLDALLVQN